VSDRRDTQLIFLTRAARQLLLSLILTASAVVLPGCGGNSGVPTTSDPGGGASAAATITITATGASPKTVTVSPGSQVTMINRDTVEHQMFSDPHPDHTDCPEINSIGFLAPGATRQTANLTILRTCGFHDHERPTETRLQGTITTR
jgi:plastocyanin